MSITPQPFSLDSLEVSTSTVYEADAINGVGFWPRAVARVIDFVVHYFVTLVTAFCFGIMVFIAAGGHPDPVVLAKFRHTGVAIFLLSLLGSVVYEIICEGVHGSTLGKLVLGMTVVQEEGTPCRISSAAVRSIAYVVDALFFGLIGYMAMQGSPQMQRHGDEWAHTIVCKRSDLKMENLHSGSRFIMALTLALMADGAVVMIGLLLNLSASM